jgi:hypothetical protein
MAGFLFVVSRWSLVATAIDQRPTTNDQRPMTND